MSSIRSTLLFLCLSFNLSSISATSSPLSLRDLQPRMMGGGMGGAGKKGAPSEDMGAGGLPKMGGAGGAGGAPKMGGGAGGYSGFIKGLMKQVPGGSNYEVVYPATVDYNNGPKQGANDALKYITGQKTKCPEQKMVLIGYSEGAMVITQLLSKQGFPAESVSSIILYGNPYWIAGKQWNAGTAKSGKSIAAMTGIKLPPAFGPKTQDICLTGDMICCGGSMGPHLKYPGSQYEKEAVVYSAKFLNGETPAQAGVAGGADAAAGGAAGDAKKGGGGMKGGGGGMKGMGGMMGGMGRRRR
ncbi:cutinase [Melampsora larici-populina 98AG31]|uniref:Cutinase n=1 Tax=Melampsora larici-populina (strain 98AG31 / pathotype 3-4-7) TaxID=747676 RepID=F4RZ64_MELLP|nr:cutinase [Melampsora larici-populina 98AG31]EGG02370.1 cutinase [Melampsora larici-populina 98AG31]